MPVNVNPFNSSTYGPPPATLEAEGSESTTSSVGVPSSVPPTFPDGQNVMPNEGVPNTPAFDQVTFLGATVIGFSTNTGWNEQQTTVTVNLVEDERRGDDFVLKTDSAANYQGRLIGCPVSFVFGSFRFDGLIAGVDQSNGFQGNPVFQVTLVSPALLLHGTQVILSNYVGPTNDSLFNGTIKAPTFQLSNILNVYGYLEGGGTNFGNSQINDTGLLWEGEQGVKNAIQVLANTNQSSIPTFSVNYGSHLFYRGHAYNIDLSALPTAPSFYRIGGSTTMTLMEIVSAICEAAGVYYLINLQIGSGNGPHTISFKIADLVSSANLNAIAEYISGQEVTSSTIGQELRTSDVTQAMILGGEISTLYPLENWGAGDPSVIPFWGFDIDGNPITGQKPDGTFFADDDHTMVLNASEIADIMGAIGLPPRYTSSILELRCALVDYDSWAAFLYAGKRQFAQALGIYSASNVDLGELGLYVPQFVQDFVNDSADMAKQLGAMNNNTHITTISQRVYEYVRNQAETYYGKQFLVKIPFQLQVKTVPESTQIFYSDEPTDAGFLPELSLPLGLNFINENYFLTPDGRMSPFFRFQFNSFFKSISGTRIVTANASNLSSDAVVQANIDLTRSYIYMGYGVPESGPVLQNGVLAGGKVLFVRGAIGFPVPAMVCSIGSPIWAQATDPLGGIEDLAAILDVPVVNLAKAAQFRGDSFPMRIHPPAFYPNGVAIAMKSNQYTYGPWGKFTSDGPVHFEQDTSLTPWDYGGYDNLNNGAYARLFTIQNPNQVKEKGTIVQPGAPIASLGDILIANGPTVGNIDVTVDPQQGITTSYSMETYIPRFGRFNDENQTRLKRFGQAAQEMRKSIRQLIIEKDRIQGVANLSNRGYMQGAPMSYAVQQRTPHAVMGGHLVYDSDTESMLPITYTETYRESVANVNAHNDVDYRQSSCFGLDGLFRPVSTNVAGVTASGEIILMSHYQSIRGDIISATPITNSGLQPLRPNSDLSWFSHGDTYSSLNNKRTPADLGNSRVMALRGPMLLSGWGYDIQGKPIPNAAGSGTDPLQEYTSSFKDGYLKNSQDWPTGAVDLHWDQMRGVWTFPTMLMGWISGAALQAGGTSTMIITLGDGTETGDSIQVNNFYSASIEEEVRVQAMYYPLDNKYYVFSANCSTE